MQPFLDLDEYQNAVFRLFRFPVLLMVLSVVGAYIVGILMTRAGMGDLTDPVGFEGFATGFFRGVAFSVIVFFIFRYMAINGVKGSYSLVGREPAGVFVPCMSHHRPLDFSMGNIILQPDRLYFEPARPFGGNLAFDFKEYGGFTFDLSRPRESMGLFLITGEPYMLTVKDATGAVVGKFILPEPKENLPKLRALLA